MSETTFDGLTIRPVGEDEYERWVRSGELAFFNDDVSEETLRRWRSVLELERTLAVYDGERIVGTAATVSFELSVPGGAVPMGGLTAVGVQPTHRRRGILTALMRRQLDELRDGREPLGGLYAAEAPIYGRFGYGSAAPTRQLTLERAGAAFRKDVALAGGVALVEVDEALRDFPAIYDRVRGARPGMPNRSSAMWEAWLCHDPKDERDGYSHRYLARLGDRGYVVYRAKGDWEQGVPKGRLRILEHMAVDPVAAASLWRFCFDVDLIATIEVHNRPDDETLPLLLANPRQLRTWHFDGLWLRPVRLREVLAARTYTTADSIVLDVSDDFCPWNAGRWRLDGGPEGAVCERTDAQADLSLSAADVGSAYLGNLRFGRLQRAGRLVEHTAGAVARADAMFLTDPAPWCPQEF